MSFRVRVDLDKDIAVSFAKQIDDLTRRAAEECKSTLSSVSPEGATGELKAGFYVEKIPDGYAVSTDVPSAFNRMAGRGPGRQFAIASNLFQGLKRLTEKLRSQSPAFRDRF
ncbi:MAG: hypothetical protein HC910_21970 [Spirulinaceae cyanobacterium SM2_1_0]|nr:hypothetical protein [Spirulinaceae cyanobacterium SM2_1_0]